MLSDNEPPPSLLPLLLDALECSSFLRGVMKEGGNSGRLDVEVGTAPEIEDLRFTGTSWLCKLAERLSVAEILDTETEAVAGVT